MHLSKKTAVFALVIVMGLVTFVAQSSYSQNADLKSRGLFVNLTTDDTWSAAMAISFAHTKVLKNGHSPVAIWLNVRGVYLADKKRPSHVHGLMRDRRDRPISFASFLFFTFIFTLSFSNSSLRSSMTTVSGIARISIS